MGVDRWLVCDGSIKVTDEGIISTSNSTQLRQHFERSYIEQLYGRTATISLIMANGEIATQTTQFPDSWPLTQFHSQSVIASDKTEACLYSDGGDAAPFSLVLSLGQNVAVRAIKLELGAIATPFVPPDPATELLKCQRYYEKITWGV